MTLSKMLKVRSGLLGDGTSMWPWYTQRTFFFLPNENDASSNDIRFKEPRHSENIFEK